MSNIEFLAIVGGFCLLLLFPLIFILWRQVFRPHKPSVTQGLLICFCVYYTLFFTVLPKYVRPYLQSHMETVQVCTYKQVLKED